MFLEQQISILELFLKNHVTLKTEVMMLKIQLFITEINDILQYIQIVILNCNNNLQHYCFYCIYNQINATLVSRKYFIWKNLNFYKLLTGSIYIYIYESGRHFYSKRLILDSSYTFDQFMHSMGIKLMTSELLLQKMYCNHWRCAAWHFCTMMLGSVAYLGVLRRRSAVTTAGNLILIVSKPPSISLTTFSMSASMVTSDAKVP